jgi:predicted transcriptional regulator
MQQHHDVDAARLKATAEIVSSFLINNKADLHQLDGIIEHVYHTLGRLHGGDAHTASRSVSGVRVEDSVTPDYIVCLEDGKKLKMLKRYLKNNYNMSPEEYRKRWGLPASYPMVAPNYAKKRSELAKDIGLGTQSSRGLRTSPKTAALSKPRTKATMPAMRGLKSSDSSVIHS